MRVPRGVAQKSSKMRQKKSGFAPHESLNRRSDLTPFLSPLLYHEPLVLYEIGRGHSYLDCLNRGHRVVVSTMPSKNISVRSAKRSTNKKTAQTQASRALLATAVLAPDAVRVDPRPAPVRSASRAATGARCSERQSDPRHSSPRALQLGTAAAASVSATLVDANLHGEGADPSDTDEPGFRRRKVSQARRTTRRARHGAICQTAGGRAQCSCRTRCS